MKKISQAIMISLVSVLAMNCEKEQVLVTYPKSFPVFDKAEVVEPAVTYNDSITVSVQLSDKATPLSTLEVQVVVNSEVITAESIRTKGNSSEVTKRYQIPFGPGSLDNEPVKVYLTSINVDGFKTDTIISTAVVKRPLVTSLYVVPETGTSYRMALIDTANLIFKSTGMSYGSAIKFRLATKIDKFNKIDWSGLVFGVKDGQINLITSKDDFIEISDPTLISITTLTFDAIALTTAIEGKLLEPVTTLDINADLAPMKMAGKDFMGGNIYFGKDVEVTFTGLTNLANNLAPDYFEITGANTAKFLGNTAVYKAYYFVEGNYLYIEPQPDVIYPEALWVCGTGLGRPSAPYATTTSWNWNSPFDYIPCRLVSEGIYQFTAYMKNTPDGFGYGTLDFKYFFKRGWWDADHEINGSLYSVGEPLYGLWVEGKYGNINGGETAFEGVYRVTLDMNNKTLTSVKLN
jgi:hypothetical protein